MASARISIVIPSSFRTEMLRRSVRSVLDQSMPDLELVVVNNGRSADVAASMLGDFSDPRLRMVSLRRNSFFCAPVNYGVSVSTAPYVATLNDDAYLDSHWAEGVVTTFEANPETGSVASLVVQAGDPTLIDSAGSHVDLWGRASNRLWGSPLDALAGGVRPVFSVSSCCAAYRRQAWEAVGGLDEDFTAYLEDVDLGFRMQLLGMTCLLDPSCRAYHYGSSTPTSSSYKAFLIERNHVWNVVKNFPAALLKRHALSIVKANARPVVLQNGSSVRTLLSGKMAAAALCRRMLRKRESIQRSRRISVAALESLLMPTSPPVCKL
ncbi:glycosyltransferase family 2 protein [Streptomyces sp. NPDC096176]|uniref:glycosyltransferase family 2 protein n=1 Tax=Streptomyces sp. NPDC096176 TaxID=3366079 RepID=UPI0037F7CA25